jgi:6-pyruvoyltetrahydropterin/6-carboxytetrahydropterin synthase
MEVELVRTFHFDAAHCLSGVPEGHECARLHGHGYRVDIHVTGEVDSGPGWLMDYRELKKVVQPVIDSLDHVNLNEVDGLENPTSEMLAQYIWRRISRSLPALSAITVWESERSRCIYRGN